MKVDMFILSDFAGDTFQTVFHLSFMTVICVKQIFPFLFSSASSMKYLLMHVFSWIDIYVSLNKCLQRL